MNENRVADKAGNELKKTKSLNPAMSYIIKMAKHLRASHSEILQHWLNKLSNEKIIVKKYLNK